MSGEPLVPFGFRLPPALVGQCSELTADLGALVSELVDIDVERRRAGDWLLESLRLDGEEVVAPGVVSMEVFTPESPGIMILGAGPIRRVALRVRRVGSPPLSWWRRALRALGLWSASAEGLYLCLWTRPMPHMRGYR